MFDPLSRYLAAPVYAFLDRRGRLVDVVSAPPPHADASLGIHIRREGERIDHLASRYLADPAGFWRIAARNGVIHVDALAEAPEIDIPQR